MTDFHSHILPGIDDGSRDTKESEQLLEMLKNQGISIVVATPHFFPGQQSTEEFLQKRNEAFLKIKDIAQQKGITVILGAEVNYYDGISHSDNLEKLKIGQSDLLLVEMPMTKWSDRMIRELTEISCLGGITVVLAHIERYLKFQRKDILDELIYNNILIQSNASFFNSKKTRRKAIKLFTQGKIHFIGSDCHNTESRPPKIGEAYSVIRKKSGEDFLNEAENYAASLLNN